MAEGEKRIRNANGLKLERRGRKEGDVSSNTT